MEHMTATLGSTAAHTACVWMPSYDQTRTRHRSVSSDTRAHILQALRWHHYTQVRAAQSSLDFAPVITTFLCSRLCCESQLLQHTAMVPHLQLSHSVQGCSKRTIIQKGLVLHFLWHMRPILLDQPEAAGYLIQQQDCGHGDLQPTTRQINCYTTVQ